MKNTKHIKENKMKIKRTNNGCIEYQITIDDRYYVARKIEDEYAIFRTKKDFDTFDLEDVPYGYIDSVYSYKAVKEFFTN